MAKDLFFVFGPHRDDVSAPALCVARTCRLRLAWMLAAHVLVVASVFVAHLHYTIDVIGAYAITFSLFALREWNVKALLSKRVI